MPLIVENESTTFMTNMTKKKKKTKFNKPKKVQILALFSIPRVHLITETTANSEK